MANIRRGFAFGESGDDEDDAARAKPGNIDSRNGSESAMPAPRRNRRRESGVRVETNGPEDAMGEGAEGVAMMTGGETFRVRQ
jgi:hypothetical protein